MKRFLAVCLLFCASLLAAAPPGPPRDPEDITEALVVKAIISNRVTLQQEQWTSFNKVLKVTIKTRTVTQDTLLVEVDLLATRCGQQMATGPVIITYRQSQKGDSTSWRVSSIDGKGLTITRLK